MEGNAGSVTNERQRVGKCLMRKYNLTTQYNVSVGRGGSATQARMVSGRYMAAFSIRQETGS